MDQTDSKYIQAGAAGHVHITQRYDDTLNFDITRDRPEVQQYTQTVAPAGQVINLNGDDIRFIYQTVKKSTESAVKQSIRQLNLPERDIELADEVRRLALEDVQRAFEMSRFALGVDGKQLVDGPEFRANYEETSGLEPVDEAVEAELKSLLDEIASKTSALMNLRKYVPQSVANYHKDYAAATPYGTDSHVVDTHVPIKTEPDATVVNTADTKMAHDGESTELADNLGEFEQVHAKLQQLRGQLPKTRRNLDTLESLIER